MLDNSGFFTVFKSEEPKNLIIKSVLRMEPIDLEFHRKLEPAFHQPIPGTPLVSVSLALLSWSNEISY